MTDQNCALMIELAFFGMIGVMVGWVLGITAARRHYRKYKSCI